MLRSTVGCVYPSVWYCAAGTATWRWHSRTCCRRVLWVQPHCSPWLLGRRHQQQHRQLWAQVWQHQQVQVLLRVKEGQEQVCARWLCWCAAGA
jgi:hypothetical protein